MDDYMDLDNLRKLIISNKRVSMTTEKLVNDLPEAKYTSSLLMDLLEFTDKKYGKEIEVSLSKGYNSMNLQKNSQGIILDVYVKPKSKEFRIEIEDDKLVVFCRETPVKGRVNRELMKELSRLFKRRVEIISGFSSRQKRVLIRDIEMNEVRQVLDATTP